jgi:hypothetical protein
MKKILENAWNIGFVLLTLAVFVMGIEVYRIGLELPHGTVAKKLGASGPTAVWSNEVGTLSTSFQISSVGPILKGNDAGGLSINLPNANSNIAPVAANIVTEWGPYNTPLAAYADPGNVSGCASRLNTGDAGGCVGSGIGPVVDQWDFNRKWGYYAGVAEPYLANAITFTWLSAGDGGAWPFQPSGATPAFSGPVPQLSMAANSVPPVVGVDGGSILTTNGSGGYEWVYNSSGDGGAGAFPVPASILSYWDPALGITLNSGHVATWTDQEGNNTVSQSVVANQPIFISSVSTANNQPAVEIGIPTLPAPIVYLSTNGSGIGGATGLFVWVVYQPSGSVSWDIPLQYGTFGGSGSFAAITSVGGSLNPGIDNGTLLTWPASVPLNMPHFMWVYGAATGSSTSLEISVDNAAPFTGTGSSATYTNGLSLQIGSSVLSYDLTDILFIALCTAMPTNSELTAMSNWEAVRF